MTPLILSVLFFTVTAYAGCTVEKSLFLSDLAGRLELRRHNDLLGPAMSVSLDSITEKDSDSIAISGHNYCFSCPKTIIDTNSTIISKPANFTANLTETIPEIFNSTLTVEIEKEKNDETDSVITGQAFQACIDNETTKIGEISIFTVSIADWIWCDNCSSQTGAFLDLTFNLTNVAPNGLDAAKKREEGFRFGSYLVKFPPYYTSGDANVPMPGGYPIITQSGSMSYVTVRFQRQQESVSHFRYEPLITQIAAPKSPEKGPPKGKSNPTIPIVLGMAIPMIVLGAVAYWCLSMRPKETQEALLTPHYYSGTYASLEESEILGVELEHDQEIAQMVSRDTEEEELSQSRCEGEPFRTKSRKGSLEVVQINM